jgi:hypothetical protein
MKPEDFHDFVKNSFIAKPVVGSKCNLYRYMFKQRFERISLKNFALHRKFFFSDFFNIVNSLLVSV